MPQGNQTFFKTTNESVERYVWLVKKIMTEQNVLVESMNN